MPDRTEVPRRDGEGIERGFSQKGMGVQTLSKTGANCSSIHCYNFPGTEVALLV